MLQAQWIRTPAVEAAAWAVTAFLLLVGHRILGNAVASLLRLLYEAFFPRRA
ncbi:hypothetical protein [Flaviaesturariibacter flavus]|uniref:hypothetical protein n=1 Tax=Flaviaesturariibacter flavus TaxID=2502780 RepID=UPI001A9E1BA1|nr:hypothetical protein [Flaviaesturariibacter flavus]